MEEIWKDVKGYEGLYQISSMGKVKSLARTLISGRKNTTKKLQPEIIKFLSVDKRGYVYATLYKDGKHVTIAAHRLVANHFIENTENLPEVNHINGNKSDNRIMNLEWCSRSENVKHAFRTGLRKPSKMILTPKYSSDNPNAKPVLQMSSEGAVIKLWRCVVDAANELGFKQGNLANCACGRQNTAYGFKWRYAS